MSSARNSARLAAFEAQTAVQAAEAASRAAESIPKPPPPRPFFDGLNEQRRALARLSPRRTSWPELGRFDERLEELDRRASEIAHELPLLHDQRRQAEQDHPARLAVWLAGGENGDRPEREAPKLQKRVEELQAEAAALDVLRDKVLEERVAFVEKHRRRLVKDADAAAQDAKARYLQLVDELSAARDDLAACRQSALWAALYPDASLQTEVPTAVVAAGLRRPVEAALPGWTGQVEAARLLELLRDDATVLADLRTNDQHAALLGVDSRQLEHGGAMWDGTPEQREEERAEKKAALERYRREWGRYPA